ncbi:hypothetical protein [Streptomyces sp. NPDC086023]|uniref:hypothetical protein n=1 Tax=Streptomyces sp. NPDC086023 TaxID=3365746 RepID=UPI0037D0F6FF
MGHQEDRATGCGNMVPDPSDPNQRIMCGGQKTTVYVYDDNGNCTSQQVWPCSSCGG